MRVRGEKEKKKETQKQVLTSNQICCIDFATLALEQIRETATLSPRIRSSLERAGSKGAHAGTHGGTSACTHTHTHAAAWMRVTRAGSPVGSAHHGGCRSHTIPISDKMRIPEQASRLMSSLRCRAAFQLTTAAPAAAPSAFQLPEQGGEAQAGTMLFVVGFFLGEGKGM